MSLPEEPFAVKANRLLCIKCGTTSETVEYIDKLRTLAEGNLSSLQSLRVEQAEGMPEPVRLVDYWDTDQGARQYQQCYIDTLRACAMRWKVDGERRLQLLRQARAYVCNCTVCDCNDSTTQGVAKDIDAEIAKERNE